jgi:colanic acid/amylovoran biosynthesis glycosyltransferase
MKKDNRKIIAHSVHTYLFGTGSWLYSQLKNVRKFHSVVVATRKRNLDVFPWHDVCFLSDLSSLNRFFQREFARRTGFYYPYFYKHLKRRGVCLLQSHFGNRGYFDLWLKEKLGVPQVTTFYGHDASMMAREQKWRKRYAELFYRCDLFLAEGNYMKKTLVELGCPPEKVTVQRLGVDLEKNIFIPRSKEIERKVRLLFAGTFREKKGLTYCLEAFANVAQKHKHMELTIVGDAGNSRREKEYKKQVLQTIVDRNIGDKVNLLGFMDHPTYTREIQNHDIFLSHSICCSDGETEGGAPVTLSEMSCCGMPVISTLHCDIPEVILDNKSGLLVPEKDVDALTERITYLVTHPETWEPMGRAGREHIEKEYDSRKQACKLEDIYTNLLAGT